MESALEAWSFEEGWDGGVEEVEEVQGEGGDDPVAFLASVFPRMSLSALRSRFASSKDLETLVEELLNEDYISSDSSASSSASTSSSVPSSPGPWLTSKQRRRLKTSAKASQTLSLTSVHSRSSSPLLTAVAPTPLAVAQPLANRWISLDSTSHFLSTLLHVPPGTISSVYHTHDSSLPLTIHSLLSSLSLSRPFSSLPLAEPSRESLQLLLPSLSPLRIETLLSATDGDVSDAFDLHLFIEGTERAEGTLLQNGLVGFGAPSARVLLPPVTAAAAITGASASAIRDLEGASGGKAEEAYSAAECAALARGYWEKRNEAFRSAAKHFQQGGGGRGTAWYWAEVGREMDRRKRRWEARGAFAVVGERRCVPTGFRMGFGERADEGAGRRREERSICMGLRCIMRSRSLGRAVIAGGRAVRLSSSPTEATADEMRAATSAQAPLRIITGIGRHSTNQNPVLMPAVVKLLEREGWRWKWDGPGGGAGAVLVTGVVR